LNLAVSSYNAFYRPHAPHHRKLLPAFALAQTADVTHLAGVLSQFIKGDYQVPPPLSGKYSDQLSLTLRSRPALDRLSRQCRTLFMAA